jgi:hypothetical protein
MDYEGSPAEKVVQSMVDRLGPRIKVTVGSRSFMVPRHYIAKHGLVASDLPRLAKRGIVEEVIATDQEK